MDVKSVYDAVAAKYDSRHDNPRTKHMRLHEDALIRKYARGRILDIGCGTGQHLAHMGIGMDISFPMLSEAGKKGFEKLVQGRAEELPFAGNSFDTVLCIFTVLNLCDYTKAVSEIRRVLKRNGIAIVSVAGIWDHDRSNLIHRVLSKRKSHMLKMRVEGKRFGWFAFNKEGIVKLFEGFRLLHFSGIYTLVMPFWGWHRDYSKTERMKLKAAFAAEKLLQPLNRAARMYFAVFEKN